jgi:hypothetical protein
MTNIIIITIDKSDLGETRKGFFFFFFFWFRGVR